MKSRAALVWLEGENGGVSEKGPSLDVKETTTGQPVYRAEGNKRRNEIEPTMPREHVEERHKRVKWRWAGGACIGRSVKRQSIGGDTP